MAVTAYAAPSLPVIANAGLPKVVDLSDSPANDLPVTVTLYGDMVDSLDPVPLKRYQWWIVGSDPDSVPVMVGDDTDTVEITLDTWYNCQVFLVCTNQTNGHSSPALYANSTPASRVTIQMLDAELGLQRLARGQALDESFNDWPAVLVDHEAKLDNLALSDINGVTISQTDLNKLANGNYMGGKHTHAGDDLPYATDAVRGVVMFEEPSATGKVPPKERGCFTGYYSGTLPAANPAVPLAYWQAPEDIKVYSWSATAVDGGNLGDTHTFTLAWDLDGPGENLAAIGANDTGSPILDNGPMAIQKTLASEVSIPQHTWVSFIYVSATGTEAPPKNLTFQINYVRYFG